VSSDISCYTQYYSGHAFKRIYMDNQLSSNYDTKQPKRMDFWNSKRIGRQKINESDRHDFKKDIPDSETLTKICCAFANTKGGFIILGVKENGSSFEISGISTDIELAHKFGQKIKANPTIEFSLPKIIDIPDSSNVLAIFEIPLSPERPHVPNHSPDKRLFQKRTNKGNDYMSYEEIKLSFQNYQERREKLKLLYIELLSNIEQLNSMKIDDASKENAHSLVTLDSTILTGLLSELYTSISKDKEFVRILFTIREKTKIINNKIKIFFSEVALPLTNKKDLIKSHNEFINSQVDNLKPHIERALQILESKFDLKNPLL